MPSVFEANGIERVVKQVLSSWVKRIGIFSVGGGSEKGNIEHAQKGFVAMKIAA